MSPDNLLHALAKPTDMVARCGFQFQLDKPVNTLDTSNLNEVCHECAVLAYTAAENRYLEMQAILRKVIHELKTMEYVSQETYDEAKKLLNL